jgi:hypothetical protein
MRKRAKMMRAQKLSRCCGEYNMMRGGPLAARTRDEAGDGREQSQEKEEKQ